METSTVIGCDWSILPLLLATNIYKNKNNENTVKPCFRDGPLENLWGGRAKSKKKFAQGKIK